MNLTYIKKPMNYRPNTGYNDWDNIHEKQTLYIGNKYHGAATKEA